MAVRPGTDHRRSRMLPCSAHNGSSGVPPPTRGVARAQALRGRRGQAVGANHADWAGAPRSGSQALRRHFRSRSGSLLPLRELGGVCSGGRCPVAESGGAGGPRVAVTLGLGAVSIWGRRGATGRATGYADAPGGTRTRDHNRLKGGCSNQLSYGGCPTLFGRCARVSPPTSPVAPGPPGRARPAAGCQTRGRPTHLPSWCSG